MCDHQQFREAVALENEFRLARSYSESQAAKFIGVDVSTLQRRRRKELVPFVDMGNGSVAYLGWQIADIIILGVKAK